MSRTAPHLAATAMLAVAAALLAPVAGTEAHAATPGEAAPGELIVRFAGDADAGERAQARREADVAVERALPGPGLELVEAEPGQSVGRARDELETSEDVVYAEPNFYRRASALPSDPYFGQLWGLDNRGQSVAGRTGTADADIDAPEAWELTTGSSQVTAAVVDSGVDQTHPDLSGAVWTNAGETGAGRETNGADDDGNGLVDDWRGWDWVEDDNLPADLNGHGSHVSGTIGASGDNGFGITGVSWRTRTMALRVLDAEGGGTVADLISAYRYAAAKGARIVNASLGGSSFSRAELDAITSAPNTLFVVAAGNGGEDGIGDDVGTTPEYPCSYTAPNVICVTASDQSDAPASFSNYGAGAVDLAAPGVNVLSTVPDAGFAYYSGTSMATPHVAGAASLLWALRPAATVAEVKSALMDGVDARAGFAGRTVTGGRLNAERSLKLIDPTATPAPGAPGPAEPVPSNPGTPGSSAPAPVAPTPDSGALPQPSPLPTIDRSAPILSLRARSPQRLRTALARGVLLRARCSEGCRLRIRLALDRRVAARLGLARTPVVGRATRRLGESAARMAVRLSSRARLELRRARRVTLVVTAVATDPAGGVRRVRIRVILRR